MRPISTTYRFWALTLAFLMFATSVSFSIDLHYCQGKLKSFSLFGKAKNCHDLAQAKAVKATCSHHQSKMEKERPEGCIMDRKDCCHNRTLQIQADLDRQIETPDFEINRQLSQFVLAYVAAFCKNDLFVTDAPAFSRYKPPLIPRDIPVLIQSFLL